MTIENFYDFAYDWLNMATKTPVTESVNGIETVVDYTYMTIIDGSQNAPAPKGQYLVIHRPYSLSQLGSAYKGKMQIIQELDNDDNIVESSYRDQYTQYTIVLSIEEVDGIGGFLLKILNTLEFSEIQDHFRASGVGFLNKLALVEKPRLRNSNWFMGAVLDVTLSFTMNEREYITWIEHVDVTGNATI